MIGYPKIGGMIKMTTFKYAKMYGLYAILLIVFVFTLFKMEQSVVNKSS